MKQEGPDSKDILDEKMVPWGKTPDFQDNVFF